MAFVFIMLVSALGGCRFAVIETGETQVGMVFSASAEEEYIGLNSRDGKDDTRVSDLQQRLVDMGYLKHVDGIFGANTESALKAFQREWGLEATGVLDEVTESALFTDMATLEEAAESTEQVLGSISGASLVALQKRLQRYGFMTSAADGEYDEQTRAAISAFQRYCVANYGTEFDVPPRVETELVATLPLGVTPAPTPIIDSSTMPVLTPAPTVRPYYPIDGVPTEALYYYLVSDRFPVYCETLQAEDTGAEVLRLQRRLCALGYLFDAPDGVYGELTEEAVRFFQRRNGILPTGVADERTQLRLFGESPERLEEVEQPYYIKVSISDQRVYVYRWVDGGYDFLIKSMICSTGVGGTTPRGVFVSPGHRDLRWHYFAEFNCWAQYAFVIKDSILFHSVIYSRADESSVRQITVRQLGHKASHGCVRLMVEDAKWIYENCHRGQVIEIY
ncbi:MAG: murein L,D-transpeptidase [Clostridia bacterium]|nr:murein L,D-transpeptidase [Clostridia bacterium]